MQDVTTGETQWKVHGEFQLSLQLPVNLYLIISKSKSKKKKKPQGKKTCFERKVFENKIEIINKCRQNFCRFHQIKLVQVKQNTLQEKCTLLYTEIKN